MSFALLAIHVPAAKRTRQFAFRWQHVDQDEAEEVFFNRPRFWFVQNGKRAGEDVYAVTGQTDAGRHLIVFFIYKADKTALILSARASNHEPLKPNGLALRRGALFAVAWSGGFGFARFRLASRCRNQRSSASPTSLPIAPALALSFAPRGLLFFRSLPARVVFEVLAPRDFDGQWPVAWPPKIWDEQRCES